MARTKRTASILLIFALFAYKIAFAGAWTQRKHGYYLKLSGNYLFTTKEFNYLGETLDIFQERLVYKNTSFQDFNVTLYLEYGLLERLTLVGTVPFKALTSKRTEIVAAGRVENRVIVANSGLSDLSFLLRYRVLAEPLVLSLQGGFKVPLGYDSKPANDGPPLGTGEVDEEINLLLGRSLHPLPMYLTGGIGYRWRNGPLHDQVSFSIEAGYSAGKFLFKAVLDGIKSTVPPPDIEGQPVVTPIPGGGGALPNIIIGDQDVFKVSPAVIYNLQPGLALQAEALHIFAGKNTVRGTIFSLGVVVSK